MSVLSEEEIDRIVRRVADRLRAERVIVFGSYAKGTATTRSDLDLLVVAETDLPPARRADDVAPLLATTLIGVDVHVYTPEEVREYGRERRSFVDSVLRTGRVGYERAPGAIDA